MLSQMRRQQPMTGFLCYKTGAMRIQGALLLIAAAAVAGGAQLLNLSEADEIEIGRQASATIDKNQPLLDNKMLSEYLGRVGKQLAGTSTRPKIPWSFQALNLEPVNAFALPGGFIYVHRGLIEASQDDNEVAGVLAHEVAHVAARHQASDLQRRMIGSLGAQVLGGLLGGRGGMITKIGTDVAMNAATMSFSREAEREADRIGAKLLYDAGYDPRGMVTLFEKLGTLRESKPNAVQQFFASHPAPEERAANINDYIATLPRKDYKSAKPVEFTKMRETVAGLPKYVAPKAPEAPADAIGPFEVVGQYQGEDRDREIAAALSPIFHQGLGPEVRYDWIGHFSFDGDWRGDNNWESAGNAENQIRAWVFSAVRETTTHFYAHYGVYHPRDYKGGTQRGATLSDLIRQGAKLGGQYDPTGLSADAVLAHENDMEGALIVAAKSGPDPRNAKVVYVETMAHNQFLQYTPGSSVRMEGEHARLFIEPKGHGIEAFTGDARQLKECVNGILEYSYADGGDQPKPGDTKATYGLMPLYSTLWKIAHDPNNDTFGVNTDYKFFTIQVQLADGKTKAQAIKVGTAGSGFKGTVGGNGLARPPWGWFDSDEKDRPPGEWFFQPAETIKRHYKLGDDFSLVYLHTRF